MSAPRPYGTDPFHPLRSISNIKQFLYIYNSVPFISSIWYGLRYVQMFAYENCACALTENSNYNLESFFPLRCMLVCIETSFIRNHCLYLVLKKGFKRKQKRKEALINITLL